MKKYLLIISAVLSLGLSYTINFLLPGTPGGSSDKFSTLVTPIDWAFSIWFLIYLTWILIGILQVIGKITIKSDKTLYSFIIAQFLTAVWLIFGQGGDQFIAFLVMMSILYSLYLGFKNIKNENKLFSGVYQLFTGWIISASIISSNIIFIYFNSYTFPEVLAYISIIIAIKVGFLMSLKKYYIVSLVLAWALIGIGIKQIGEISVISYIGSVIILLSVTFFGARNMKGK